MTWSLLQHPINGWKLRSVAADADGRFFGLAPEGLVCWDGIAWRPVPGIRDAASFRFVLNLGAGRWLLGGEAGIMARYDEAGDMSVVHGDSNITFRVAAGDLDDMAVLVGSTSDRVALFVLVGRRWMRPFALPEVKSVHAISSVDDARWLVVGQTASGGGHAALFSPLDRELLNLSMPSSPELLATDGARHSKSGIAVGERGAVLVWTDGRVVHERIDEEPTLTAAALGSAGEAWAGGEGSLWLRREAAGRSRWTRAWSSPEIKEPFILVAAEAGMLRAVTASGGVVEGRRNG